jgi:stage V sporulation protein D (sporulation-specific penicillin-binding protein)
MTVLMSALLFRTAWIQVVQSETYTDMATRQQTSDISIPAKRGIIYDRNGEELAVSAAAYTVWVRPAQIREIYKDETKRTEMAYTLSPIIGKESGEILEVFFSDSTLTKLVTDLDKETAQAVRDLEYSGLEVVEVTKRYYPMGAFAATVLGSVNEDGVGRSGIELEYNDYLSGIAGRTVMDTDLHGNKLAVGDRIWLMRKITPKIIIATEIIPAKLKFRSTISGEIFS